MLDIVPSQVIVRKVNRFNIELMEARMNFSQRCACCATFITLGLAAANTQADVINGYAINPRVFNDNPGSTLTFTPPVIPSNPATFSIHDQYSGPFGGANRD